MAGFNIKGKAKELGSGIMGILMFLGFCILPFIFIFGVLKVSEILFPIISVLAGASVTIFLLIILPLSLFKNLHGHLAGLSINLSYVVGASVFMFSFLTIFHFLGWIALFLMFMFQLVSPIAAIGLFFKGEWGLGFYIVVGLAFIHGMRFYGFWLSAKAEERIANQPVRSNNIIDAEAVSEPVKEELIQIEDSSENIEEGSDDEVNFDA